MTRGRPPVWNPIASLDATVWTEAVEVASKGRLGIPVAARRCLGWWDDHVEDGLLASLEQGGLASLVPWAPAGIEMMGRVGNLIRGTSAAERGELVLAAMDRFMRVGCEANGRLVLPANLMAHIDPLGTGKARVIVLHGQLQLCAEHEWQAAREARLALLDALKS